MAILISNRQNRQEADPEKISRMTQQILNDLGCPDGELSILIVDDPRIAELNKEYLSREGPTNVIAFPMREGEFSDITPELLGDVVISADTARKEGEMAGVTAEERFTELLIHGILHLFGYDHETTQEDADRMERKSLELLKQIRESQ